ncbi:Flagellar motility protein MotE, a chaperone for MotC folding [Halobacillus karajensis]|uniref:MotE family protein n=1 Tax=Halobacillus karajensis TaxID=195088 RepID=UPI0008A7E41D|nr:hypothetical protein [Halobacillus karajensis]SEH72954.1 Flagellar motility protein MotE, a chaperone for MotC folding [Halobacillus karajensis]
MAKSGYAKQNKMKTFPKVIFAIFIPFIFLITFTMIVLTLLGFNVFEEAEKYAGHIPGVSQIVSLNQEGASSKEEEHYQEMLANKETEIENLQREADSKQDQITALEQQILQLEADLEEARSEEETGAENSKVEEMAQSFQKMDADEAAPIIENMDEDLAVQVLNLVSSEEKGEILGQMKTETAASVASRLIEE